LLQSKLHTTLLPALLPSRERGAGVVAHDPDAAKSKPTQRDRHLQLLAEHGRMSWQKRSGYTKRARVEAAMSRCKQLIGGGLRAHTDECRATEVAVAVHPLNRILELKSPTDVRIAGPMRPGG